MFRLRRGLVTVCCALAAVAIVAAAGISNARTAQTRLSVSLSGSAIQHVLLVTVDGMKPESYTEPDAHGLKVPTLREMVRRGAYSDGVQPVMPTVTYPSHASIATGANPGTHGIVSNTTFDPLNKNMGGWWWYAEDIRVPTLWDAARDRGLKTALVHWPVTLGAEADLNVPEYWRAQIPEDLKLLRAASTPRGVLGEVAKEFPDFEAGITPPEQTDAAFTDIACYAVLHLKPNLLLLHIPYVDHWQHEHGPFSAEGNAALENADAQIARLIATAKSAGIWETTAVVVASDHGFLPITKTMRPGVLLKKNGLVAVDAQDKPTAWKAGVNVNGGSAYIYLKDDKDEETRKVVLAIFHPMEGAPDGGIRRVATREQIAAMGGDSRAFIALEAADGYGFGGGYSGELVQSLKQGLGGTHGYFPDRAEMRSSLVIYGPPIRAGKIENARMIDIGPTVAKWLGFELTKAEGKPLDVPLAK